MRCDLRNTWEEVRFDCCAMESNFKCVKPWFNLIDSLEKNQKAKQKNLSFAVGWRIESRGQDTSENQLEDSCSHSSEMMMILSVQKREDGFSTFFE